MLRPGVRWADVEDSEDEDIPRGLPFFVILHAFLAGVFDYRVSRETLQTLQALLQRDPRAARLPAAARIFVDDFSFVAPIVWVRAGAFIDAVRRGSESSTTLRLWQAWLQLEVWRVDLPVPLWYLYIFGLTF